LRRFGCVAATTQSATRPTTMRAAATTGKTTQPTTAPRRRKYRAPATGTTTRPATAPATKAIPPGG
jgi:hypothetical protein